MNKPKNKGLKRALKKLTRLADRGARRRTLLRLRSRINGLAADYDKRITQWREAQPS